MICSIFIVLIRAIQIYAEKIFPSNVRCQTIHSLAYAKIGYLTHTYIIWKEHEYHSIHLVINLTVILEIYV